MNVFNWNAVVEICSSFVVLYKNANSLTMHNVSGTFAYRIQDTTNYPSEKMYHIRNYSKYSSYYIYPFYLNIPGYGATSLDRFISDLYRSGATPLMIIGVA